MSVATILAMNKCETNPHVRIALFAKDKRLFLQDKILSSADRALLLKPKERGEQLGNP